MLLRIVHIVTGVIRIGSWFVVALQHRLVVAERVVSFSLVLPAVVGLASAR